MKNWSLHIMPSSSLNITTEIKKLLEKDRLSQDEQLSLFTLKRAYLDSKAQMLLGRKPEDFLKGDYSFLKTYSEPYYDASSTFSGKFFFRFFSYKDPFVNLHHDLIDIDRKIISDGTSVDKTIEDAEKIFYQLQQAIIFCGIRDKLESPSWMNQLTIGFQNFFFNHNELRLNDKTTTRTLKSLFSSLDSHNQSMQEFSVAVQNYLDSRRSRFSKDLSRLYTNQSAYEIKLIAYTTWAQSVKLSDRITATDEKLTKYIQQLEIEIEKNSDCKTLLESKKTELESTLESLKKIREFHDNAISTFDLSKKLKLVRQSLEKKELGNFLYSLKIVGLFLLRIFELGIAIAPFVILLFLYTNPIGLASTLGLLGSSALFLLLLKKSHSLSVRIVYGYYGFYYIKNRLLNAQIVFKTLFGSKNSDELMNDLHQSLPIKSIETTAHDIDLAVSPSPIIHAAAGAQKKDLTTSPTAPNPQSSKGPA